MTAGSEPRIRPLGDAAVLVELGDDIDLDLNRRVRRLSEAIAEQTAGRAGWGRPIAAATSILVPVDPLEPGANAAATELAEVVSGTAVDARPTPAERLPVLDVPTVYDGADLDAVAEITGLSAADVIAAHAGSIYTALFLGFAPGFAYLGPLPPRLVIERRTVPRTHVGAGSVAIAGAQTAVYPVDSPGGWWLIGRTQVRLWDPSREPPAMLRPGRRVRFIPEVSA